MASVEAPDAARFRHENPENPLPLLLVLLDTVPPESKGRWEALLADAPRLAMAVLFLGESGLAIGRIVPGTDTTVTAAEPPEALPVACGTRLYAGLMGCDEPVGSLVVRAILAAIGLDWVGSPATPGTARASSGHQSAATSKAASRRPKSGRRATSEPARAAESPDWARQTVKAPPPSLRPAVTQATEAAVDQRVEAWRAAGNNTAIGNLGEQVALRVLGRLGYDVLAAQDDLKGAVSDIVGKVTRMNPEDFVAVAPDNRYTTINVKATASESTSLRTATGDLSTPRMSKGQNLEHYYSTRAGLLSPLDDGASFGQVMKVDLVHKTAQLFEIDEAGKLSASGKPIGVLEDVVAVCLQNPDTMPAPVGPNVQPDP
jgi:hypothetical protein